MNNINTLIPQCTDNLEKQFESLGNKAAANWYFQRTGLFDKPLAIIHRSIPILKIPDLLLNKSIDLTKFAIRFSLKNEINLPRGFFSSLDDGLSFIAKGKRLLPDATVIVHDLIFPHISYESYLDDHSILIQAMPGIWEMENKNNPDMLYIRNGEAYLYRNIETRNCKYLDTRFEFFNQEVVPIQGETLKSKFSYLLKKLKKIEPLKKMFNPIFCRTVEESNHNQYFLNLRETAQIRFENNTNAIQAIFHELKTASDIDKWDNKQALLFSITSQRENSRQCLEAIERMKQLKVAEVYIRFGLLSHPAILLRESGINVKQINNSYEIKKVTICENQSNDFTQE